MRKYGLDLRFLPIFNKALCRFVQDRIAPPAPWTPREYLKRCTPQLYRPVHRLFDRSRNRYMHSDPPHLLSFLLPNYYFKSLFMRSKEVKNGGPDEI